MVNKILIKNKSIFTEGGKFEPAKTEEDKQRFRGFVVTQVVPFNEVSRNGYQYDKQSIIERASELIGKPVMYNHKTQGGWEESKPYGEWIETWISEDGMYGKYGIYNAAYTQEVADYLRCASAPRHSLNVTGEAEQVKEKDDGGNDVYYSKAYIRDWHEASIVPVPGFDSAKAVSANFEGTFIASIQEAFNNEQQTKESLYFEKLKKVVDKEDTFVGKMSKIIDSMK